MNELIRKLDRIDILQALTNLLMISVCAIAFQLWPEYVHTIFYGLWGCAFVLIHEVYRLNKKLNRAKHKA